MTLLEAVRKALNHEGSVVLSHPYMHKTYNINLDSYEHYMHSIMEIMANIPDPSILDDKNWTIVHN